MCGDRRRKRRRVIRAKREISGRWRERVEVRSRGWGSDVRVVMVQRAGASTTNTPHAMPFWSACWTQYNTCLLNSAPVGVALMRQEHMLVGTATISSIFPMCSKFRSHVCFAFRCKLIRAIINGLLAKFLCIRSGLDLNVIVM